MCVGIIVYFLVSVKRYISAAVDMWPRGGPEVGQPHHSRGRLIFVILLLRMDQTGTHCSFKHKPSYRQLQIMGKESFQKVLLSVRHTWSMFSLWDWRILTTLQRLWHSSSLFICLSAFFLVYQTDLYPLACWCHELTVLWHWWGKSDVHSVKLHVIILKMSQQKEKVQHGGDWKQLLAAELWSLVYVCFIKHLFLFYFSSTCGRCQQDSWWSLQSSSATHRNTEHLAKQAFTLELNLITLATWFSFDFLTLYNLIFSTWR